MGTKLAIMLGESGHGKTTVLECLQELEKSRDEDKGARFFGEYFC